MNPCKVIYRDLLFSLKFAIIFSKYFYIILITTNQVVSTLSLTINNFSYSFDVILIQ